MAQAKAGAPATRGLREWWKPLARLAGNLARLLWDLLVFPFVARVPRDWVVVRLDRGVVEFSTAPRLLALFAPLPGTLPAILRGLRQLREDDAVFGVVVRMGAAPLGWAVAESLVRALSEVRDAGKLVVVYARNGTNATAWLGAHADQFWMAPHGQLGLIGFRLESPFVHRALEQLGVRPLVFHAGRYKSTAEIFERESMSDDSRMALDAVADTLYDTLVSALARRAGDAEIARQWIDQGPFLASEAFERGLVDALVYPDELPAQLAVLRTGTESSIATDAASGPLDSDDPVGELSADPGASEPRLSLEVYQQLARPRFRWKPVFRPASEVAVVYLLGMVRGRQAEALVRTLRQLERLPHVRAVVLRIDSPGGDPDAADMIWRAVKVLSDRLPVVASMGNEAASGGYYAAMAAHEIIAEPTTLTGSIGVVLASVELDPLLDRVGVGFDGVQRGEHAGIYSPTRARSSEEREVLRRHVDWLYQDFVSKVAEGRGTPVEEVEPLAQGRVWIGADAMQHGLVDALGGLDLAIERARERAGLEPDQGEPVYILPRAVRRRGVLEGDPLDFFDETAAAWSGSGVARAAPWSRLWDRAKELWESAGWPVPRGGLEPPAEACGWEAHLEAICRPPAVHLICPLRPPRC